MKRILGQINDRKDEDGFYPLDRLIFSKKFLYTLESDIKLYSSILITTGTLGLVAQILTFFEEKFAKNTKKTKNKDENVSALSKRQN